MKLFFDFSRSFGRNTLMKHAQIIRVCFLLLAEKWERSESCVLFSDWISWHVFGKTETTECGSMWLMYRMMSTHRPFPSFSLLLYPRCIEGCYCCLLSILRESVELSPLSHCAVSDACERINGTKGRKKSCALIESHSRSLDEHHDVTHEIYLENHSFCFVQILYSNYSTINF